MRGRNTGDTIDEHVHIFDAIREGNAKAAGVAMREHLDAHPQELGLMDILSAGATRMREPIAECIDLCMCAGRVLEAAR